MSQAVQGIHLALAFLKNDRGPLYLSHFNSCPASPANNCRICGFHNQVPGQTDQPVLRLGAGRRHPPLPAAFIITTCTVWQRTRDLELALLTAVGCTAQGRQTHTPRPSLCPGDTPPSQTEPLSPRNATPPFPRPLPVSVCPWV